MKTLLTAALTLGKPSRYPQQSRELAKPYCTYNLINLNLRIRDIMNSYCVKKELLMEPVPVAEPEPEPPVVLNPSMEVSRCDAVAIL